MAATGVTKLRGFVQDGAGQAATEMTGGPDAHFYSLYFGQLMPGTFNVLLDEPYLLVPDMPLAHTADGRVLRVQSCSVENLPGFLIQLGGEAQPSNLLHIVSAFPLRRFLRLQTGSEVNVKVAAVIEPSNGKGRQ